MSKDHALSWLSVDALWVYNETFGSTHTIIPCAAAASSTCFAYRSSGIISIRASETRPSIVPGVGSGDGVYRQFLHLLIAAYREGLSNCTQ